MILLGFTQADKANIAAICMLSLEGRQSYADANREKHQQSVPKLRNGPTNLKIRGQKL